MVAYLQLADNPGFTPAFDRVVNTPKRGIGKVGLDAIKADAKKHGLPAFEVCAKALGGGSIGGIKPAQKKALRSLVDTVLKVRQMAQEVGRVLQIDVSMPSDWSSVAQEGRRDDRRHRRGRRLPTAPSDRLQRGLRDAHAQHQRVEGASARSRHQI